MAASAAKLRERTLSEQIASINGHMEELAAAGEWDQVLETIEKRDAMLGEIDDTDRKATLLAARRSTARIRALALNAQREVAEKLTELQRGREATDTYRANT